MQPTPQRPRTAPAAASHLSHLLRAWLRLLLVLALVLATTHLLAGCGGGDPEPDQANPTVNCALQPVVCR